MEKIAVTDSIRFCLEFDKPIFYKPNYGNLGDALIAVGTRQAFTEVGITPILQGNSDRLDSALVVYGGGGNLVPYYKNCSAFLKKFLQLDNDVVLLPHTVAGHTELISSLDQRFHVFCRDLISYDYVGSLRSSETYFDHDLALRVKPEKLFEQYASAVKFLPQEVACVAEDMLRRSALHSKTFSRTGYLLRGDQESSLIEKEFGFDLSGIISGRWTDPNICYVLAGAFLLCLSMFDKIFTDRLHVAIGASLLGISTTLYPNSYYKNHAVYMASLKYQDSCITFEPIDYNRYGSSIGI